jgi:hypothetical protein
MKLNLVEIINTLRTVLNTLIEAAATVVVLVELVTEGTGEKGAEKRALAVEHLRELVDVNSLPAFLQRNFDGIAGFLIDAIVSLFNRQGFFAKS